MSLHVAIRHNTSYKYDRLVRVFPQLIRLKPAAHSRTTVLSYSLKIQPKDHFINWQQDPFGNFMARVTFPEPIREFTVSVEVIVDMITINPFDFFLEEEAGRFPFTYNNQLKKELQSYLEVTEKGTQLEKLFHESKQYLDDGTIDFLVNLNKLVYDKIGYNIRLETGIQSCEDTLTLKTGSCRDSGWLLVQLLRMHGLAARFVSGYLIQLRPDQKSIDGPSGAEQDFTDLHAWAEVYVPGAGWIGLDATSGLLAGEGHIPLSCTPNPGSSAPITGMTEKCEVTFGYENLIERIYETPRVTKPYTDNQWSEIIALGHHVDERLITGDARLTMGGEPTFVSVEEFEADEWNTTADGEEKRKKGYDLTLRLKDYFAPNGLIHQGQGKWYPGEPIPRWQYVLYWRKDNIPLWSNDKLLDAPDAEAKFGNKEANEFIKMLSHHLGFAEKHVLPAYEDYYYFLWEQSKLPLDANPLNPSDDASLEQKKLAEILKKGKDEVVGYILPLKYNVTFDCWQSSLWKTHRERIFLIPGDSSMGYRLPLESLEKNESEEKEVVIELSLLDDLGELVKPEEISKKEVAEPEESKFVRTAICIEPRDGRLYIFFPPLDDFNQFIKLISTVNRVAETLGQKIIIEGYQPPADYRVEKMAVTPDPGVLEVNVPPASSWTEILKNYDRIFDDALHCKLASEKFMIDGRHIGTGGGNHITLGGTKPDESPLLLRPDLLRSMLNFWHNHPGMSYLFSSTFVGPTSQAPRVDEGRRNSLEDLKIAFRELDRHTNPPPWLVDRIFRNILIDLTGNTHRAEFCIDKLYSPDSQSGRLGILELRGFDMPPSKEMCLIQLLLVRSLIASFWERPYRQPLIEWGSNLHDKYLLHYYVKEDMTDVIHYLNNGGFEFKIEWLEAFFAFRFPVLGECHINDAKITIRAGIEPWYVLGEEMSNAGTSRFVDSSVEKIEVMISGMQKERYDLLCNQVKVPLRETPVAGTYVAGIKYKAWNPPSSLHPTIGVDTPLTFDIYDKWNERSVGGCTYHVVHPGGRNYDTFPVNALEAEARRVTRFFKENHTQKNENVITDQGSGGGHAWVENRKLEDLPSTIEVIIPPEELGVFTLDLRKIRR